MSVSTDEPCIEWAVQHQAKMNLLLTLSMGNDCRISVLTFFNVIMPSIPIWTILYLKLTLKTEVLVLVYSLRISISPTQYSSFLFSNFLMALDTFLHVSFKNAISLGDAVMSSVYEKYFSMICLTDSLFKITRSKLPAHSEGIHTATRKREHKPATTSPPTPPTHAVSHRHTGQAQ